PALPGCLPAPARWTGRAGRHGVRSARAVRTTAARAGVRPGRRRWPVPGRRPDSCAAGRCRGGWVSLVGLDVRRQALDVHQDAAAFLGSLDAHAVLLLHGQRQLQGVETVHLDAAFTTEQRLIVLDVLPVDVVFLVAFADQELLEFLFQYCVVHCVSRSRRWNRKRPRQAAVSANSSRRRHSGAMSARPPWPTSRVRKASSPQLIGETSASRRMFSGITLLGTMIPPMAARMMFRPPLSKSACSVLRASPAIASPRLQAAMLR